MIALIKTLQVILALGILILVHEFGHFFFAKLFGIRVDKFFLFFDAGGFKLLSTKTGWFARLFPKATQWETEYGIGWLPLGGYCKIAGMIDESMDTEHLKTEPQPWEFRTKPAWQRLLVMAGGVLFNFIFAVMTYSTILGISGEAYIKNEGNGINVNGHTRWASATVTVSSPSTTTSPKTSACFRPTWSGRTPTGSQSSDRETHLIYI